MRESTALNQHGDLLTVVSTEWQRSIIDDENFTVIHELTVKK